MATSSRLHSPRQLSIRAQDNGGFLDLLVRKMQGVGVTLAYMLSDAVWVQLLYGYAERVDDSLGTGGFGDIAINPLKNFQLFKADLNVKF